MKRFNWCCLVVLIFMCASCEYDKDQWFDPPGQWNGENGDYNPHSGYAHNIKIAVVPDIHYMHPALIPLRIEDSQPLMDYLRKDRKILELSDPIFRKVISEIILEKPDIVLIPGDLTKDGELISHLAVRHFLQYLERRGIKVYVVPGNNDIVNPDAMSFRNGDAIPVQNISFDKFRSIYADFGYDEAFAEDENSLSYICKPYKNLWIMGIDNCNYSTDQDGKLKVTGAIDPATLTWIENKMVEARNKNVRVLTMMHYGIIQHYKGQDKVEPLIADCTGNASALMNAGISLIFTGHYHANDIAEFTNDGKKLYDIQTGSLVTPPFSYRIMYLDDNSLRIDTKRVTSIYARLPGGVDFLSYCNAAINDRLTGFFNYYLMKKFSLAEGSANFFAPYCVRAWKAYFAGDEQITAEESEMIAMLPSAFAPLTAILKNVWTDLPPEDNTINISLSSNEY
jgi:hypothetical protein